MLPNNYLVYFLIYKNLQLKYKHSVLGFVWSFLHPFFYLLIFNFVFSKAFSQIQNYSLFVISGLLFWVYFSGSTNALSQTFIRNTQLLKSFNVNKILYPVSEQGAELVSFLSGFVIFSCLMVYLGMSISFSFLWIIPITLLFTVFCFSVGLILGSLNVYFRDVGILWNTLNPALFYLSPIAYSIDIIPVEYQLYFKLNPIYHFLIVIRNVLYDGTAPSFSSLMYCIVIALTALLIALFIYKRTRNGFISNL
jgi:ABC-type polysaccharide/polyol phosphate export permease